MTYRTPVLISDDPIAERAAQLRGWKVLLRDEQLLRFEGLDHAQTVALPPLPFSIDEGSLGAAHAHSWDNVLNWLQKHRIFATEFWKYSMLSLPTDMSTSCTRNSAIR